MATQLSKSRRREAWQGFLFIQPWLIGFLIFTLGPLLASLVFSTWKWNLFSAPSFVGPKNYWYLFTQDPDFWHSLKITTVYSVARMPLTLILGLFIAMLLNQKIRALGVFRTVYYLPSVLPMVATSMLFMWLYNPNYGVVNFFIEKLLHIRGPGWVYDEKWVIPALIVMSLWWVGSNMLVYLAGLQGVPTELYEAATIDGAGLWAKFRYVTLPMITPVLFYNVITTLIASFETFTQVFVMLDNRPMRNALFYVLYLYNNAFRYFRMGYASALAWIFFIILFALTLLVFKSSSLWVFYESNVKGEAKRGKRGR